MRRLVWILTALCLTPVAKAQKRDEGSSVEIIYDDPKRPATMRDEFAEPVDQIFSNQALVSGLASGADALNRSVETLMDAVFYSLLDNEFRWKLTDDSWFSLDLQRKLYNTSSGAYVVVERVGLGPRYGRELGRIHNLPITLGADGSVEVLQIYLRTDGMRVAEQKELPWWRIAVNNWFGLLPLASSLLPPSFNPNELYDPLKQLSTPFVFPFSVDTFYDMPLGSIRSYAISGGVHLALNFDGALDRKTRDILESMAGMNGRMPYTVFKRGEHRINVLRRGENIAWVGVSELNRTGHSLSSEVGNRIYILTGALAASFRGRQWTWKGVPGLLFPLEARYEQAMADLYDQVYEFDLRNPHAREAYSAAVRGDFTIARGKYLDQVEKGIETGVVFHFTRNQSRTEASTFAGPNVAVYRSQRDQRRHKAEIEITDQEGKFYILEARQWTEDEHWDVLVGQEDIRSYEVMEIKVRRVYDKAEADAVSDPESLPSKEDEEVGGDEEGAAAEDAREEAKATPSLDADLAAAIAAAPDDPGFVDQEVSKQGQAPSEGTEEEPKENPEGRYTYAFAVDEDPVRVAFSLEIQDRYLTADEYHEYLEFLRYVTALPIDDVPDIDERDPDEELDQRRRAYFASPDDDPVTLHVTPTYLGRFGAKALINFSTRQITAIVEKGPDAWWRAFAEAYGKDVEAWGDPEERETLGFQAQWWPAFLALPLRLFNVRIPSFDAIAEASGSIAGLKALSRAKTPVEWLAAAHQLFDTDYPDKLIRALLLLSDIDSIPRRVSFSAQSKGSARHEIKRAYDKLNGRVFQGKAPFPEPGRYARSKEKLSAFYLDQPHEQQDKPRFARIQVSTRPIPDSIRRLDADTDPDDTKSAGVDRDAKHVHVRLEIEGMAPAQPAKVYARIEQAGRIKIGKLELAEKVLELSPVEVAGGKVDRQVYEFFLTGPLSPLSNFVFDQAIASGGDFQIVLAASRDGAIWSDEKTLEFRYELGRLMPPE